MTSQLMYFGPVQPVVSLRGVCKSFGRSLVLDHVDLDVAEGQTVVILGPSGSGKSTLLRCVNALEPVDEGRVLFDGVDLAALGRSVTSVRARIGMVFQQFNLFGHLTVLDNITLGPRKVGRVRREDAERHAAQLLESVGIPEKANAYPAELSGGQQQRVAIARALAQRPKLMMFDEPTSALDPEMISEVLAVMENLSAQGMTMLVVTHEMGFARHAADRVVFIDEGRLLEEAAPDVFFSNPQHPRSREFLSRILSH